MKRRNLRCCANWIYTTCSHPGLCFFFFTGSLCISFSLYLPFSPEHSTVILPIPLLDNSTIPSRLNYALSSSISSIFAYFIQSTTGEPHWNSTNSTRWAYQTTVVWIARDWNRTSKFLNSSFLFFFNICRTKDFQASKIHTHTQISN